MSDAPPYKTDAGTLWYMAPELLLEKEDFDALDVPPAARFLHANSGDLPRQGVALPACLRMPVEAFTLGVAVRASAAAVGG